MELRRGNWAEMATGVTAVCRWQRGRAQDAQCVERRRGKRRPRERAAAAVVAGVLWTVWQWMGLDAADHASSHPPSPPLLLQELSFLLGQSVGRQSVEAPRGPCVRRVGVCVWGKHVSEDCGFVCGANTYPSVDRCVDRAGGDSSRLVWCVGQTRIPVVCRTKTARTKTSALKPRLPHVVAGAVHNG